MRALKVIDSFIFRVRFWLCDLILLLTVDNLIDRLGLVIQSWLVRLITAVSIVVTRFYVAIVITTDIVAFAFISSGVGFSLSDLF